MIVNFALSFNPIQPSRFCHLSRRTSTSIAARARNRDRVDQSTLSVLP